MQISLKERKKQFLCQPHQQHTLTLVPGELALENKVSLKWMSEIISATVNGKSSFNKESKLCWNLCLNVISLITTKSLWFPSLREYILHGYLHSRSLYTMLWKNSYNRRGCFSFVESSLVTLQSHLMITSTTTLEMTYWMHMRIIPKNKRA